jgi:formylglycine-generating enzyme required for sulfatase activity
MGREHFPINCVEYENAQAFCAFDGGSLPSEAQWELAAQVSGRTRETRYPWGNQTPNCERAVYARSDKTSVFFNSNACIAFGVGPVSLDASPMDTSVGLGIVAMGGSMTEWLLDSFAQLDAVCWERAPLHDPLCSPTHGGGRSVRGGSWATPVNLVYPGNRLFGDPAFTDAPRSTQLGFRCVRPADL